ncbi:hypothetical protein [Pseudonocardia broussonetiae]|uniref:Uncharacterized protein n=1 Tax=Pseudonocardia broussonetiae TaxID=2736640 RepID=A0A6M6JHQ1_9PSEU|nr:hypothetical protein [Pseudonocardia broussonetiae]QJY46695.1 hypothetical protein HOP40_13405 [Pseudonocardia broussonetiae]
MTAPAAGVNEDLLRRVLDHITTHPDQHSQDWWARRTDCGTVACIAGHTVLLTGHTIDFETPDEYGNHGTKLIDRRRVEDVAAELLGLNAEQAWRLFHDAVDLQACWAAARSITGGRIQRYVPRSTPPTK